VAVALRYNLVNSNASSSFQTHRPFITQGITTLNLESNAIADVGAQHLVRALENSTVSPILYFSHSFSSSLSPIDTNYSASGRQSNRSHRGPISRSRFRQ
jgi:hypothetical protein